MVGRKILVALAAAGALAGPAWAESDPNAAPTVVAVQDGSPDAALAIDAAATASLGLSQTGEPVAASDSGWEVSFVPYIWASAIKADITTPQGEDVEIDESFTDILGNLKFVFMGALDARHDRFVAVQDLIFLSMESTNEGNIGPGLVESETDLRVIISTTLAGYRVVDKGPMFVDLMAGARISSLRAELELSGPLQTVERESSETKVGPVIASRFRVPLGENWGFALYGDLGGFGVTADLSWQLLGTVQYQISDHWTLGGGWRHVAVEQEKDGFDIDLTMTGPFLAFRYRF